MAPRGDFPLSPSEPLISSAAPPHPCPAPPASRSIQHQRCLTRGCAGGGLRAPCAALLFCSSLVSPRVVGSSCTLWATAQNPEQKECIDASFSRVFQEVGCAHDMAGCKVCCPITLGTGPVWFSPLCWAVFYDSGFQFALVSMVFIQISDLTCPLFLPEPAWVFSRCCLPCASWVLISRSHPPPAPDSASPPKPQHL